MLFSSDTSFERNLFLSNHNANFLIQEKLMAEFMEEAVKLCLA